MISRLILLSIFTVSTAFMMSAENADSCVQSQRTQEQFQQEFNEFIKNTRAYMLAKEIIPADSVHLLSKKQKKALHIAKHNTFTESGLLNLPLEVNRILNDTTKQYYRVSPLWEKAYYEKNDTAILIIPLKCNDSLEMIQSQLRVIVFDNGGYSREVETVIAFEDSSVEQFSGILIYSSIMGELEKIFQFKNGECVDILYNKMLVIDKPQKNKKTNVNLHKKAYDRTDDAKRRMSWYPPIGITISTTLDPIKK